MKALTGERAGLRKDGRAHEQRVAELVVIGHGILHLSRGIEAEIGRGAHALRVAHVAGAARELREQHVSCEHQGVWPREAVA
jgi:hypothetical protein